jgi:hypothetical protein
VAILPSQAAACLVGGLPGELDVINYDGAADRAGTARRRGLRHSSAECTRVGCRPRIVFVSKATAVVDPRHSRRRPVKLHGTDASSCAGAYFTVKAY